jgi:hypothetical protein
MWFCSSHSLHGYSSLPNLQCLGQEAVLAGPMSLQLPSLRVILAYEESHHELSGSISNTRFSTRLRLRDLSRVVRYAAQLRLVLLHLHLRVSSCHSVTLGRAWKGSKMDAFVQGRKSKSGVEFVTSIALQQRCC